MVAQTDNPQILIIEDDIDHAFLEENILKESMLCDVLTVRNSAELRPEYIKNSNIILLDFNLPDANGAEVLKKIRSISDIPVIMITADDQQKTAVDTLKGGATDFVLKSPENIRLLPNLVISTLNQFEEKKQQIVSQKQKDRTQAKVETLRQVLTTLAHYINNSTTTIFGYAQLCQQYPDDLQKQKKLISVSIKETRKISWVLQELEEFVNKTEIKTTHYVNIPEAMFAIEENLNKKIAKE